MGDILELVEKIKTINTNLFSMQRILILKSLEEVEKDGALYRELKGILKFEDGTMYSNLKLLTEMGFIKSKKVKVDGKEMTAYLITPSGKNEFNNFKQWLKEAIG